LYLIEAVLALALIQDREVAAQRESCAARSATEVATKKRRGETRTLTSDTISELAKEESKAFYDAGMCVAFDYCEDEKNPAPKSSGLLAP
jgi:hypothetical protein